MSSNVQSVIFLRSKWSVTTARRWLKSHDYKATGKVDSTVKYHRFRQQPPSRFSSYSLKALGATGVKLVIGH